MRHLEINKKENRYYNHTKKMEFGSDWINTILILSLREGITERSGVIPSKQSFDCKTEIASSNRTPPRMTDHAGRSILLAMT